MVSRLSALLYCSALCITGLTGLELSVSEDQLVEPGKDLYHLYELKYNKILK